jgi:CRISPR/Cas system CSM-associated protein Csm2 small subunit
MNSKSSSKEQKRNAGEMVRVNKLVRAALTLMRADQSVSRGRRVTDNEILYELLKEQAPEYLKKAAANMPPEEQTEQDEEPPKKGGRKTK